MALKLCLLNLVILSMFRSCQDDEPIVDFSEYHESMLVNEWIHSYEGNCKTWWMEFSSDRETYLPTWQLRNRLELYEDHSAVYTIDTPCDPNYSDASDLVRGQWRYDPELNILEIISDHGNGKLVFMVKSISENSLGLMYKELDPGIFDK